MRPDLSAPLAPHDGLGVRRHRLRREHRVGELHGRIGGGQPRCRRHRRSRAPSAPLVRRDGTAHRRHRAGDAGHPLGASEDLRCALSIPPARAAGTHRRAARHRAARAHRADDADGGDAAAGDQRVGGSRRLAGRTPWRLVRQQRHRRDCRDDCRGVVSDSRTRDPRHISDGRRGQPGSRRWRARAVRPRAAS